MHARIYLFSVRFCVGSVIKLTFPGENKREKKKKTARENQMNDNSSANANYLFNGNFESFTTWYSKWNFLFFLSYLVVVVSQCFARFSIAIIHFYFNIFIPRIVYGATSNTFNDIYFADFFFFCSSPLILSTTLLQYTLSMAGYIFQWSLLLKLLFIFISFFRHCIAKWGFVCRLWFNMEWYHFEVKWILLHATM